MQVQATTAGPLATEADTIAVGVFEGESVAHDVADGALAALLESGEANRSFGHLAVTHAENRRFVLVGLGGRDRFDGERAREAAALTHGRARELGARTLCWEVPHHVENQVVAGLVHGTLLHAYRFDRYRPESGSEKALARLLMSAHHDVSDSVRRAEVAVRAQNRARDLANTPANDLTPSALAEYARRVPGVQVTVLDEQQIRAGGMGAFAAVAQGSEQAAQMICIEYEGAPQPAPRIGLIGKAVTFDSGGISLKQPATMHEMKFDMSGGGAVIEAIGALAELHAPVSVLGVVGATENLPSGRAVKPGDIVRALDGTTIEVNNTDAEGRLVLADCLCYARERRCDLLLDIATLTAIDVALGSTFAALMSNDDVLAAQVLAAAADAGELVWRMPLHADFTEMVKGRYARLTNRTERREAMPSTAAAFLQHFAGELPWAHLDIAGTAWDVPRRYFADKGATGFGVKLLAELAQRVGSTSARSAEP
ncbi:MAG: leucyl aminopeptidase [Solirubrobacterales bacterium]|nr:leucyl aminopeptidase [Solirubrobacterales bacterium]